MVHEVLAVTGVVVLLDADAKKAVVRGHNARVAHGKVMKADIAISRAQVSCAKGLAIEKFVNLVHIFRRGHMASIQLVGRTSEKIGDRV